MNDETLKELLKQNVSMVPEAAPSEAHRIWQHLEQTSSRRARWWLLAPATSILIVVLAVSQFSTKSEALKEEEYLFSQWSEMVREVDTDVYQDVFISKSSR